MLSPAMAAKQVPVAALMTMIRTCAPFKKYLALRDIVLRHRHHKLLFSDPPTQEMGSCRR